MNVSSRVVLITGASQGIGAGLAEAFGAKGHKVIVNYYHSKQNALNVVKKINASGGQAVAIKADVSRRKQVELLVKKTLGKFGRVDILINNAGAIFEPAGWQEISEENWRQTIDVNLKSIFECSRAVYRIMKKNKKGRIINISSLRGRLGGPEHIAYAAAKAGVENLTKSFAVVFAPFVTVNCVVLGRIKAGMNQSLNNKEVSLCSQETLMGRIGNLADVINAVDSFASNASSYITGQSLVVDGGLILK